MLGGLYCEIFANKLVIGNSKMTAVINKVNYEFIIASDVIRDGLGIELWNKDENVMLAEIFRNDNLKTIQFYSVQIDLPLEVLELLIAEFESRVGRTFQV